MRDRKETAASRWRGLLMPGMVTHLRMICSPVRSICVSGGLCQPGRRNLRAAGLPAILQNRRSASSKRRHAWQWPSSRVPPVLPSALRRDVRRGCPCSMRLMPRLPAGRSICRGGQPLDQRSCTLGKGFGCVDRWLSAIGRCAGRIGERVGQRDDMRPRTEQYV